MKTLDFDYDLPEKFIGQKPILDRSASKLMVLDKNSKTISHAHFYDLINYLNKNDCLVLNDSRVLPARLQGHKETGASIETLLLKRQDINKWEVLLRPAKRLKIGQKLIFSNGELKGRLLDILDNGNRLMEFEYEGVFEEVLNELGEMPLPPYIHEKLGDKNRYQTVYSKYDGSAAAPTAGLHFTHDLLDQIRAKGIKIAYVTLHVGIGTFRPVQTSHVENHSMHSESCFINQKNADIINKSKESGGRIIAVGTTSCRTLESIADENGYMKEAGLDTDIFIYPGYKFKIIDGLITNFHLPKSSLLMLVSAFATRDFILAAYEEAKKEDYRFFSFGDAMLIL